MGFLVFVMFLNGLLLCTAQDHVFNVTSDAIFTRNCARKRLTTVNHKFPGPEITVNKRQDENKTVTVTVNNRANYDLTIHWHGVKQPGNPWSDGPEYVTQCPIKNDTSFSQTIILSDEVGTLWWHAHSDWTRGAVHGAIIIKPPEGNDYPFDPQPDGGEETIIIASWHNGSILLQAERAEQNYEPLAADAYTINGNVGSAANPCADEEDTFTMKVISKMTYLLHIVNAVLNEQMYVAIANHSLTVVAMDGAYVDPFSTETIMMGPGNTMDVLVTATQASGRYYMVARRYTNGGPQGNTTDASAILQYGEDTTSTIVLPDSTRLPMANDTGPAETFMNQLSGADETFPKEANVTYNITLSVFGPRNDSDPTYNGIRASLSNIRHILPSSDFLLNAALSCVRGGSCTNNTRVYTDDFPTDAPQSDDRQSNVNGTKLIVVDYNTTVDLVFQGTENGPEDHPMHLHGHSFYLIERHADGHNTTSYDKPPLLNTIAVPKNGWAKVRFVANNPGVWFIHCHLERHATWGMATTLIVKEGPNEKLGTRPSNMPSCT